uniref:Pentraxin family member n=1 Tax=Moschus moschiferus TaxID=68415 RepID=A0A8C6EC54_MOSMO
IRNTTLWLTMLFYSKLTFCHIFFFSSTDLRGKVFIFPEQSNTAYVALIPRVRKPLRSFTLCLKAFTDLIRPYSLLSYSTKSRDNELLLYFSKVGEYRLSIGNTVVTFKSVSGVAEFWVNGRPVGRKGLRRGYTLGEDAKIILGQEQDSFGRNFDAKQFFVGEIWDVSLWDHVVSLKNLCSTCYTSNILKWKALIYQAKGYVVVKTKL